MAPGPARLQLGSLLKLATGYLDAHLIPQMGHPLPPEPLVASVIRVAPRFAGAKARESAICAT